MQYFLKSLPAVLCLFIQVGVRAQSTIPVITPAYLQPWPIELTTNKTSTILFHYRIRNIDTGSAAIMARLANDTALWLKATTDSFPETNLSVFTADGRLHAFTVRYAKDPRALYILTGDSAVPQVNNADPLPLTDDVLDTYCQQATWGAKNTHARVAYGGVSLRVKSIYAAENLLFFTCILTNRTAITFDISHYSFSIRDKGHVKRTAHQVQLRTPIKTTGNLAAIAPETTDTVVFALPGFTVPKGKRLLLTITEQSGGRNLVLPIRNRAIIKAGRL